MNYHAQLAQIGVDASAFRPMGNKGVEIHGPCPRCGGKDRFSIKMLREFPHWYCFCRPAAGHCGFRGWADQLNSALRQPISKEQREKWAKEQREAEELKAKKIEKARKNFEWRKPYMLWHKAMTDEHRAWWRSQGIPDDIQDFDKLGYAVTKWGDALTIPYLSWGYKPINAQYRVMRDDVDDRYKWIGLGYSSFGITKPDIETSEIAYICEGYKKARVFSLNVAKPEQQVYWIPCMNDIEGIQSVFSRHDRVYVGLDPDASLWAEKLCSSHKNSRMVEYPDKIDDMILAGRMSEVRLAFSKARKVAK